MALSDLLYAAYERRLRRRLDKATLPRHVGVMLDGNRRWAAARGHGTKEGHQAGADNIANFLEWCEEARVEVVTLWLLSTDNLNRPEAEVVPLLSIIENAVTDLAATQRWRICPVVSDPTAIRGRLGEVMQRSPGSFEQEVILQMRRLMRQSLREGNRIAWDEPQAVVALYHAAGGQ